MEIKFNKKRKINLLIYFTNNKNNNKNSNF